MYLVVWHDKSTLTDHYEAFEQLSDAQTHYASLTDDTSVWSASITVPIESTDYEVNTMEPPESPYEALVMALKLGLNAPGVPQAIAQRYTTTTDDKGKARFPAGTPGAPTRKRPRRR